MDKLIKVGKYKSKFNKMLGINLPTDTVYVSNGLDKHIQRRHPNCTQYIDKIPLIISDPDYIGKTPKSLTVLN